MESFTNYTGISAADTFEVDKVAMELEAYIVSLEDINGNVTGDYGEVLTTYVKPGEYLFISKEMYDFMTDDFDPKHVTETFFPKYAKKVAGFFMMNYQGLTHAGHDPSSTCIMIALRLVAINHGMLIKNRNVHIDEVVVIKDADITKAGINHNNVPAKFAPVFEKQKGIKIDKEQMKNAMWIA
jgi:hypothetical protein